jgi:hypothetical protein
MQMIERSGTCARGAKPVSNSLRKQAQYTAKRAASEPPFKEGEGRKGKPSVAPSRSNHGY